MSEVEVSHLIEMGMACLGVFFIVISAGTVFIYLRLRQQNESGAPPPSPPPMTIDPHAVDDTSALPSIDGIASKPLDSTPPAATPAPIPEPHDETAPIAIPRTQPQPTRKTYTPVDEDDSNPTERSVRRTLPAGLTALPDDATDRVRVSPNDPAPNFISPIGLDDPDEDSATVIIDRSKSVEEDEL